MKAWKDFRSNTRIVGYSSTPSNALKIKNQLTVLDEVNGLEQLYNGTTHIEENGAASLQSPMKKEVVITEKTPSTASTSTSAVSTVVDQSVFSAASSASSLSNASSSSSSSSPGFTPYARDNSTTSSRRFKKSLFNSPSPIANRRAVVSASSSSPTSPSPAGTSRSTSTSGYSWKEVLHARKSMSEKQSISRRSYLPPSYSSSYKPKAERASVVSYECIHRDLESFKEKALEGLEERANLDDEGDIDVFDFSLDGNQEEIEKLRVENLGLKDRIQRYEAELFGLVECCNKCPTCSILL